LAVSFLSAVFEFLIQLQNQFYQNLDVQRLDHVPDDIMVNEILLSLFLALLIIFRVEHQRLYE